jgi:MFS family permease
MATASVSLPSAQPTGHPLSIPHFRNLWLGGTISLMGDQFYLVALPWLILQLTGSSLALGTILMTAAIPRAVLMLMGGVLSDRVPPRRILMSTASARSVLVGALALLVWIHDVRLWHVYILAGMFGVADAFSFPASQALVPTLVAPQQLPAANSTFQSTAQLTSLLGPAPAGVAIKSWGMPLAFCLDAISFLFVMAALWRLPNTWTPRPAGQKKNVWHSILEGLKYVMSDPALRSLVLLIAALNFCVSGPVSIGLATMAKFRFGSSAAFGTMLSCVSGGTLGGLLLAGVFKRVWRRGWVLIGLSGLLAAALLALSAAHALWAVGVILVFMGVGSGFTNVQILSWIQTKVDRAVMGRVMSVLMFSAIGLLPMSLGIAGAVAQLHLATMFVAAGSMVMLATVVAACTPAVRAIE